MSEMMTMASRISQKVNSGRSEIGIQDGPEAGQTVNHVHIHVLPYGVAKALDSTAINRTEEEMNAEAEEIRELIES